VLRYRGKTNILVRHFSHAMDGFLEVDWAAARKETSLALSKLRCQCDENGEPWDQVRGVLNELAEAC
jgi:hypothetical protein